MTENEKLDNGLLGKMFSALGLEFTKKAETKPETIEPKEDTKLAADAPADAADAPADEPKPENEMQKEVDSLKAELAKVNEVLAGLVKEVEGLKATTEATKTENAELSLKLSKVEVTPADSIKDLSNPTPAKMSKAEMLVAEYKSLKK